MTRRFLARHMPLSRGRSALRLKADDDVAVALRELASRRRVLRFGGDAGGALDVAVASAIPSGHKVADPARSRPVRLSRKYGQVIGQGDRSDRGRASTSTFTTSKGRAGAATWPRRHGEREARGDAPGGYRRANGDDRRAQPRARAAVGDVRQPRGRTDRAQGARRHHHHAPDRPRPGRGRLRADEAHDGGLRREPERRRRSWSWAWAAKPTSPRRSPPGSRSAGSAST